MTALVEWLKPIHRLVLGSNTDPIHFAYSVQQFPVLGNFESFFLSYEMGLMQRFSTIFWIHLTSKQQIVSSSTTEPKM